MRLTNKELIALHLLEFVKYAEALDVPAEMTQEGVARAIRIELPHFRQYVRPLVADGLVRERTTHVKGGPRRRKVYDLTDAGKLFAVRLRENVKAEVVRVRDAAGMREARVAEVLGDASRKASILDVIHQVMETGIVDLATLDSRAQPSFVEMLGDAPKIESFVGRHDELSAITQDDGGPRITVVRGVAGIGKTSLAAKACELLRGRRNQFWHRVQPWDTHQSLLSGIGDFLAALGKPGLRSVLRRGEGNRAAQILREDLPATRAFLVFDDAHEASPEGLAAFRLLKDVVADITDTKVLILTRKSLPFYDRRDVTLAGLVREIDLPALGPEEAAAYLLEEGGEAAYVRLARRVRGHPLFLGLARAHHETPSRALQDVERFIEEEIYAKLGDAERPMMKLASLYRVAVPRDALLADPSWPHDTLLSLLNRSLIRRVGEDRFEVHDTVRESIAELVTPSERRRFGSFAVGKLRELATEAVETKDLTASVNYLSNALQLSTSAAERAALWEALGDVNQRVGDLLAISVAYREAMKAAVEAEALARLHRKMASILEGRGEIASASHEIEEGFRALADLYSIERGWLELVRCRVLMKRGEVEEAQESVEAALKVFQQFSDRPGEAEAFLELGRLAYPHSPSSALRFYEKGLALSDSIRDPEFPARVLAMVWPILHASGDVERAKRLFAAVEVLPGAEDPWLRMRVLNTRADFAAYYLVDYSAAERDNTEARRLAIQIRDTEMVAWCEYLSAFITMFRGRAEEARGGFERAAEAFSSLGLPAAANSLFWAGMCCVMEGDYERFKRITAAVADLAPGDEAVMYSAVFQGFNSLLEGDQEKARFHLVRAIREAEKASPRVVDTTSPALPLGHAHFAHGVALRAMGRTREAEEEIQRALDLRKLERAWTLTAADQERRLVEGLRRMRRRKR